MSELSTGVQGYNPCLRIRLFHFTATLIKHCCMPQEPYSTEMVWVFY